MADSSPDDLTAQLRIALRNMADAYERRIRTDCTVEQLALEPWRCAEYIEAERLCKRPFKLLIDNETLKRQIAAEPDGMSCEAGVLHPEAPKPETVAQATLEYAAKIAAKFSVAAATAIRDVAKAEREIDEWIETLPDASAKDFEAWWKTQSEPMIFSHRAAKAAWQAAHTALPALFADVMRERDEVKRNLEWQTHFMNQARREAAAAEAALATAQAALAEADAVIEEVFGDIPAPEDWCVPGKLGSTIQDALARHKASAARKRTGS